MPPVDFEEPWSLIFCLQDPSAEVSKSLAQLGTFPRTTPDIKLFIVSIFSSESLIELSRQLSAWVQTDKLSAHIHSLSLVPTLDNLHNPLKNTNEEIAAYNLLFDHWFFSGKIIFSFSGNWILTFANNTEYFCPLSKQDVTATSWAKL